MKTRSSLLAVSLAAILLAPAPAMAREKSIREAAAKLNDPKLQATIAGTLAALSQALMGMKAAPFVQAMEQMEASMGGMTGEKVEPRARNIDPDATLGDLAGPEMRAMPEEMASKVPAMMGAMAGMAGSIEAMLPELQAMAKRLKDAAPRR